MVDFCSLKLLLDLCMIEFFFVMRDIFYTQIHEKSFDTAPVGLNGLKRY